MNKLIDLYRKNIRRSVFLPSIIFLSAYVIIEVSEAFRLYADYHFLYTIGHVIGLFLAFTSLLISIINCITLLKIMILVNIKRYDFLLLIVNFLPIIYVVVMILYITLNS